jgi:hypothetical protein
VTSGSGTLSEELGQTYFNANKMSPEHVARLYVRSSHLDALTSQDNVLLVGPRGSGKTTLMKMLTRPALDTWGGEVANDLLRRPVLPMYVGSDTVLRAQLQVPESQLAKAKSRAAFAIVRRGKLGLHLVETAIEAVAHEIAMERASLDLVGEAALCDRIAAIFRLEPAFPSLGALRDAVGDTLLEFSSAIQSAADGDARQVHDASRRYQAPALADVLTRCQSAVTSAVDGLPRKWLLLFDEIEYLSDAARSEVLLLIRSLGPTFALKIALTPLSITENYLSEVEKSFLHAGHDFLPLSLGFDNSHDVLEFSQALATTILSRLVPEFESLPGALGVSAFADPGIRTQFDVHYQTRERRSDDEVVRELAAAQPRFAEYAEKAALLDGLETLTSSQRAARYRKALPVMLLWLERLRPTPFSVEDVAPSAISRRGRKAHQIYCGFPTFLLLADGNPRVLMRMLNRLLKQRQDTSEDGGERGPLFPAAWQDAAIESARREQIALANAYLSSHGPVFGDLFALDVLHEIGQQFEEAVHRSPKFSPDPATTFTIDEELPPALTKALVDAYYTGVLVSLDPIVDRSLLRPGSELRGNRFRLSYLQGCHYWLPVRKGRQVKLSSILSQLGGATPGKMSPLRQERMF